MKRQHFVTFFSPGTFCAEETQLPIKKWDVDEAVRMASTVVERYNARPFGFRFQTRARTDKDLDSKVVKTSCFYFLGGKVETLQEIEARHDPKDDILIENMRCNHWDKVLVNLNSWRSTLPLREGDVVLDVKLEPLPAEAKGA